jgi:mRNA interferase MazF
VEGNPSTPPPFLYDRTRIGVNRVQVVPLSTQVDRLYPSEAIVTLNGKAQKAMADQITTVSKQRLSNRAGRLSAPDLAKIERIVKLQLDFIS